MHKLFILAFIAFFICSCTSTHESFKQSTVRYDNLDLGIPGKCDRLIDREGYAVGYSFILKQPIWVTYRLTCDEVNSNVVRRMGSFMPDNLVDSDVIPDDYIQSGFDRGHLAPAADMHWSTNAMFESFYMSNMSPQTPKLNRYTWAKLEAEVRRYAVEEKSVFVVSGPIVTNSIVKTISSKNIVVPDAFFKIVYDETPPEKMIAFVMPNSTNLNNNIYSYATNAVYVESITRLHLFSALDEERQKLKFICSTNEWAMK